MMAQDLVRFGIIYGMFIMGFAQAYYIMFQSYSDPEENPLSTPMEAFIRYRFMTMIMNIIVTSIISVITISSIIITVIIII